MMATTNITQRLSPVELHYTTPSYAPKSLRNPDSTQRSCLGFRKSGFGSRHLYDDAPFTLWKADDSGFRYPTSGELKWLDERYHADRIDLCPPDMLIHTQEPPELIPFTVAAMLVRFIPTASNPVYYDTSPTGAFKPLSKTERHDILPDLLLRYEFPPSKIRNKIIDKLRREVDIRAVHFFPPLIIVEIDVRTSRYCARKSLPAKAGGLNIMYHQSEEGYWKGTSQDVCGRLTAPISSATDQSHYLQQIPFQLSPGVCLSTTYIISPGLPASQWCTTTSGVLLQNGTERRMTAANQGFQDSAEVYHPNPQGQRIGQIMERLGDLNIALIGVDPSILFRNERYFEAPSPKSLAQVDEILSGEWFTVDGISTGRIDLCARIISYYPSSTISAPIESEASSWNVELGFSSYGASGAAVQDGVRGAPIVDQDGRVAGFFTGADSSGIYAFAPVLDPLIDAGWSVV